MDPHVNNFLAPEPFIVQRLEDALSDLVPKVTVGTSADLAAVKDMGQFVPAVFVVWNGFKGAGGEQRSDGRVAKLTHTWFVVSVVRHVGSTKSGAAARALAGELSARAGGAVMGFRPPNVAGPMVLAPNSPPSFFRVGFMYLPLAFNVDSIFKAT